ncbi:MAG: HlyD family secretion protein [Syntrophomonadaceae bacterium]
MSEELQEAGQETRKTMAWASSKRRLSVIILLAFIGLAAVGGLVWHEYAKKVVSTDNAKVAGDIVDISSKLNGRLEAIKVKEEQYVEQGQVIAELDLIPLQLALNQAEAALEQAQANYDKLPEDIRSADAAVVKAEDALNAARGTEKTCEIALAEGERAMKQNETLYQAGALSEEAYKASQAKVDSLGAVLDTARANTGAARAALEDAVAKEDAAQKTSGAIYQAQLKKSRADYEVAKYNLDNASIKAPISGTVVRVSVQAGENVSFGQTILSICDLENAYITANIDEQDIARVKPGQKVEISIDAYSGQTLNGQVDTIGGAAQSVFSIISTESSSGNYTKVSQRLPIKIAPEKGKLLLRPGMSAVIKIHTI